MFWVPAIASSIIILTQILFISLSDEFRMADTIGDILGGIHPVFLILLNVLLFAILTGLAGLSGVLTKSLLYNNKT